MDVRYLAAAVLADALDGACASWTDRLNVATNGGEVAPIGAMWLTRDYFSVLAMTPIVGRDHGRR